MKRFIAFSLALSFLAGCALSTIEPHKKKSADEPPKGVIESIFDRAKPDDEDIK